MGPILPGRASRVYGGGPAGPPTMNETEPEEVEELIGMQYASLSVSGVPATLHSQFAQDGVPLP
jgi:hypothetical protein